MIKKRILVFVTSILLSLWAVPQSGPPKCWLVPQSFWRPKKTAYTLKAVLENLFVL